MEDTFDLNRFIEAQSYNYNNALAEIRNGRKTGHWMWYIFPQFKGLGRSFISEKYAIKSREEAVEYFRHPVLKSRLIEITEAFLNNNKSSREILGNPDFLKMKSCMTLFYLIQEETDIFKKVIDKFYNGSMCNKTQQMLSEE